MAVGGTRTSRTLSAFQNHDYRLLWPANFFSYIARWMQMTLLSWLVLELTDSPFLVALVAFFGMAPMLFLGVFGGVLADRANRKRLIVITQSANVVASLVMTVLLATGTVEYWHAYALIMVSGIGWALDMPSRRSMMHDLVGRSGVTNAIALDSVAMHSSKMLGPALAGIMITLIGVDGGYGIATSFYLIAVVLLSLLTLPPRRLVPDQKEGTAQSGDPDSSARKRPSVYRNLMEGFRYVRGNDTIMAVVAVTVLMNLLLFPYMQMIPVIARDVLGVGPALMGILMAADGLGALVGAILIASATSISYHGRYYLVGSLIGLLMVLLFSFSRWYGVSLPILIILGLGTSGFGTMQGTIVMLVARDEMRGRALGILTLAIGAGPLGALMVGGIASATSVTFAIGLNAVLGLIFLALVAALMPTLIRKIQTDEPLQPTPEAAGAVQGRLTADAGSSPSAPTDRSLTR